MPTYDVECSACGYEAIVALKLAELDAWDLAAVCPQCSAQVAQFRRVIKSAAASLGATGSSPSDAFRKGTMKKMSISEKETMKHKQAKNVNHDHVAEARESAHKGGWGEY